MSRGIGGLGGGGGVKDHCFKIQGEVLSKRY